MASHAAQPPGLNLSWVKRARLYDASVSTHAVQDAYMAHCMDFHQHDQ